MQEGVFALIDCLGWKGIWKGTADARKVLKKISDIQNTIIKSKGVFDLAYLPVRGKTSPKITFLSDTVAISIPPVNIPGKVISRELKGAFAVEIACYIVSKLLDLYVEEEPFLTMRGCITYGEHLVNRNTFVGPAVDEAAINYELPQGAFVWVHPKASRKLNVLNDWRSEQVEELMTKARNEFDRQTFSRLQAFIERMSSIPYIIEDFEMPIKGGGTLTCPVVNPLMIREDGSERAMTIERYASSFNNDTIDVLLKKQNTMNFLAKAAHATLEFYENADRELWEKMANSILAKSDNPEL